MMNNFVAKLIEKNKGSYGSEERTMEQINSAKEKNQCMWHTEGECAGDFMAMSLFKHQITVCVCVEHYIKHTKTMMLHAHGDNVDEILADDLSARFEKTFGTPDVNRESCMVLFAKHCPDISVLTDDELIELLDEAM